MCLDVTHNFLLDNLRFFLLLEMVAYLEGVQGEETHVVGGSIHVPLKVGLTLIEQLSHFHLHFVIENESCRASSQFLLLCGFSFDLFDLLEGL